MKTHQRTISLFLLIFLTFLSSKPLKAQSEKTYTLYQTLASTHQTEVTFTRFNQNSIYFASGDKSGKVVIWKKDELQKFVPYRIFTHHTDKISDINFSDDNELLITAGYDGKVNIYSISKDKLNYSFKNPAVKPYENLKGNEVSFAVFDPKDATTIYFGGYNRKVFIGKLGSTDFQEIFSSDLYAITSGEIKDNQLAIGYDAKIQIFNTQNLQNSFVLGTSDAPYLNKVCEIAFLNQSNKIVCWLYNGKIQIWDLNTNQLINQMQIGSQHGSSRFEFSKDDKNMLSGNYGNEARWWNVSENDKEISIEQSLTGHQNVVRCISVSDKNNFLATADGSNIKIWKLGNDNSSQITTETITQKNPSTETSMFVEAPSTSNFVFNENINMRLQFEKSESILLEESYKKLNEVIAFLKKNTSVIIELHGHTDDVGNQHLNLKLSAERILTTKNYMVDEGIEPSRITTYPHGQAQPLNDNHTEKERQQNRRVEMILKKEN